MSGAFWTRARELATHYGAALIADEIQCGLGRTGRAVCLPAARRLAGHRGGRQAAGGRAAAGRDPGAGEFRRSVFAGLARLDLWRRTAGLRRGAGISGDRSKTKTCWRTCAQRGAQLRAGLSRLGAAVRFHPRGARRRPDDRAGPCRRGPAVRCGGAAPRADHQLHARSRDPAAAAVHRDRAAGGRFPGAFPHGFRGNQAARPRSGSEHQRGGFSVRCARSLRDRSERT